MRDDVAFQSQVFGEQVAQRRDRYAQQNIDTAWRGSQIPMQAIGAMQARQEMGYNALRQQALQQEMELQSQQVASQLATDELKRQDAIQQLQWARELHSTDMIQMQKDMMAEDLALKRAEVKRRTQELEGGIEIKDFVARADAYTMASIYSMGIEPTITGNRMNFRELQDKSLQSRAREFLTSSRYRQPQEYTQRQMLLDIERATKMAEDPELDDNTRDWWRAQADDMKGSYEAAYGKPVARAPQPKPAPDPMANPEFRKRVESTVSTQPMLVANMGAKNSERLMKEVLRNPEPWRKALQRMNPDREFTDQEIAATVAGYAAKAIQTPTTNDSPVVKAWRGWLKKSLDEGLLDWQEIQAAQEAMGASSREASAAGRNIK